MPVFKLDKKGLGVVGLGTGKIIDIKEIDETIENAIKLGYRLFDTAYGYKNEAGIGQAIKKQLDKVQVSREELCIITKLPLIGMHPNRVSQFLDISLSNLQLDYIDLYLIHWPMGFTFVSEDELMPRNESGELMLDMTTNLEQIWLAMEDLVEKGKVRSIGLSNCNIQQISRILSVCKIPPAYLQVEIHIYFQQKELREFCMKHEISVIGYAPLASPGRKKYINAHKLKIPSLMEDPVVKKVAVSHEKTPAQILLRYLIQVLDVSIIPKSVNYSRLKENIDIFDFELSSEEIDKLKELDEGEIGRSCLPFDGAIDHPECPFKAQ